MIISHLALNLKKGYPQEPLVFFSLFLHYIFHNFPYRPATGMTLRVFLLCKTQAVLTITFISIQSHVLVTQDLVYIPT